MTDLEFKLYEALRKAHGRLGQAYQALSPGDEDLHSELGDVLDAVIWPAVYGDDDVIKAADAKRAAIAAEDDRPTALICGQDDATSCDARRALESELQGLANRYGGFRVEWPTGPTVEFSRAPDFLF